MIALPVALVAIVANVELGEFDPTRVHRFVLRAPAVGYRTGPLLLPKAPAVRWRVRVPGGIVHAPTITPEGAIVVAHTLPNIAQYDGSGRLQWTARLGASPAAASPLARADGTRVVLSEAAEAFCFSASGTLLWSRQLPLGSFERAPSVGAVADGSLFVADGRRMVRLDASGAISQFASFDQEIRAVFGDPGFPLVVGVGGAVARARADGRFQVRGEFGSRVDAVVRLDANRLLAILDGKRLAELDLRTASLKIHLADPNLDLGAALAATERTGARLLANGELFMAFAADGRERFRVQLATALGPGAQRSSADLALDPEGTALIVRPGADAAVVHADGTAVRVDATACTEPLRPVPLPGRAVVLACRSGILARLNQR